MAQKDKVLKVSFGAFSCTLEGFDDPVETLKEVTEYFRALSASDPGFGDEPKLPDTENLARLVQQDDSKSVDIRTSESGSVMLRAEDAEFVPSESEDDTLSEPLSDADADGSLRKRHRANGGQPAEGSVADKLQRIRAVVSSTESEPSSDDLAEDDSQTARFFAGQLADTASDVTAPDTDAEADSDTPDQASDDQDSDDQARTDREGDDELLQSLGQLRATPTEEPESLDEPALGYNDTAPEQDTAPEAEDDADTSHDQILKQVMSTLSALDPDLPPAPPETPPQDTIDDSAEDDFSQPYVLRPDQMITSGADAAPTLETDRPEPQMQKARKSIPQSADTDLARLMAATEERMGAPETAEQRETYSQLRAAVVATGGGEATGSDTQDTETAFHDDLASVVRPSRPTSGGTARPEPGESKPPLQLVPEQRVSSDGHSAISGPVRPRRVYPDLAEQNPNAVKTGDDFARYASEHGTSDLPDILEAAAAYLSFVEGRTYFTRPQLMNTLRQYGTDMFPREECLRAFGALLRQGKITKVGSGRYAASEQIDFRPAG